MTAWVLGTSRHTASGMPRFADPVGRRHDAYHWCLSNVRWDMGGLWKTLVQVLIDRFCPAGVIPLALDNILFGDSGWNIEKMFKCVKQLLGGQEVHTWQRQRPKGAAGVSL